MLKVGFLLGAGASFPFGIPMMTELYSGFVAYVRKKRPHCDSLLQQIETKSGRSLDIESLISNLDRIRAIREGMRILDKADNELDPNVETADELRGYLDAYLVEVCERFDVGPVDDILSAFVKFCHERNAFVFSTNYDRLIETAADRCSLPCIDGFEQSSNRPESRWVGKFEDSTGLKLIKLHGSVNWYREEGSDEIFRLERGYSLPSHEYRLTRDQQALRPLMIIPTLEKAVLENPYSSLLTTFSDALKIIDVLFIIGNSMRDVHIRNTIDVRRTGLEIFLINPDCENQVATVGWEGEAHTVPIGTKEFMTWGVPMLDAWVRQTEHSKSVSESSRSVAQFVEALCCRADARIGMGESERRLVQRMRQANPDELVDLIRKVEKGVHQEVVGILRETARSGRSDAEQVAAIDALADLGDTGAVEILCEVVEGVSSLPVRAEATLALKNISETGGVDISEELERMGSGDRMVESLVRRRLTTG